MNCKHCGVVIYWAGIGTTYIGAELSPFCGNTSKKHEPASPVAQPELCGVCAHPKHEGKCSATLTHDAGTLCPCVMAVAQPCAGGPINPFDMLKLDKIRMRAEEGYDISYNDVLYLIHGISKLLNPSTRPSSPSGQAAATDGWIMVEDALPATTGVYGIYPPEQIDKDQGLNFSRRYFVANEGRNIYVGNKLAYGWVKAKNHNVTHWRELPAAPSNLFSAASPTGGAESPTSLSIEQAVDEIGNLLTDYVEDSDNGTMYSTAEGEKLATEIIRRVMFEPAGAEPPKDEACDQYGFGTTPELPAEPPLDGADVAAYEILHPDGKPLKGYDEADIAEVAAIIRKHERQPAPAAPTAQWPSDLPANGTGAMNLITNFWTGDLKGLTKEGARIVDSLVAHVTKGLRAELDLFKMVLDLLATDELFLQPAKGEGWVFWVNVNDMFYPAADGEGIDLSEIPAVWKAWKESGWTGVVRWVQEKRGGLKLRKSREEKIITIESLRVERDTAQAWSNKWEGLSAAQEKTIESLREQLEQAKRRAQESSSG